MRKIRVLFLAASPHTTQSELNERMYAIRSELQNIKNMVFDSAWAASVDDLQDELDLYQPHILHFIRYGSSEEGIVLPGHAGAMKPVEDIALNLCFGKFDARIGLIVLDACYIPKQAKSLIDGVVDYVIGIKNPISISESLRFATILYNDISKGDTLEEAFEHSKSAMPSSAPFKMQKRTWAKPLILLPKPATSLLPLPSNPRMSLPTIDKEELDSFESPFTDQPQELITPLIPHYALNDVFVKSGVPDLTFVKSEDFVNLKFALMAKERSVIIEGPSGIGKTTAVLKAIEEIQAETGRKAITTLSASNLTDVEQLETLESWHDGTVIIDNFHRLDVRLRQKIAHYLAHLTDTRPEAKKLVIVGIPQGGLTLVNLSYDLTTRIGVFHWSKVKDELVLQMIKKGEQALNIEMDRKAELSLIGNGSLKVAQLLCFYACQQEKVLATQEQARVVHYDINKTISLVQTDLSLKFGDVIERFAALDGPTSITCLQLLNELANSEDGHLSLTRLKESNTGLAHDIERFINEHWPERLYQEIPDSKNFFFFHPSMSISVIDDPQFTFYLKNLSFPELARKVGKVVTIKQYKVVLCHHGNRADDRWLQRVQIYLKPLEDASIIEPWDIAPIVPDSLQERALQIAIETSNVVIPLVSAEFLAGDFIANNKLSRLLKQAQIRGTSIIPLIVAPCLFNGSDLDTFQPANLPHRSLEKMNGRAEWGETLVKVAEAVRKKFAKDQQHSKQLFGVSNVIAWRQWHTDRLTPRQSERTGEFPLSLFSFVRITLEEDNKALVGKTYSALIGLSTNKPPNFEGEGYRLPMPGVDHAMSFDILIHTSKNILASEWNKTLHYDPFDQNLPPATEFSFSVTASGSGSFVVDFYQERHWLNTTHLKFDTKEQSEVITHSSGG